MSLLPRHTLTYYRSDAFAQAYLSFARRDQAAAILRLRSIVGHVRHHFLAVSRPHPSGHSEVLSQLVDHPISVEQMLTLVRMYASRSALQLPP